MKYLKLFKSHNIESICKEYGIENYTLNSDGSIDVDDDVYLAGMGLTKLPIKFHNISGYFNCNNNRLTSLEGSPKSVGRFYCDYNQLTSLEGGPKSVVGNFSCHNNKITSLEVAPKSVGGDFNCNDNKITSLEFSTQSVGGDFYCGYNQLASLEFSPKSVGRHFCCHNNKITSLEGAPQSVGGDFYCNNNKITSLEGGPKSIGDIFWCKDNPLHNIWKLISPDNNKWDSQIIELFNDYDCIRGSDIIMDRFNDFLMDIGKDPVDKVDGYNNI